ncbi:MAG: 3-dehydroquinate synthase [Ktedonobacteraceae bacterium]
MEPIHQVVQVTYHYSVYFTEHLFAQDNLLFRDVLSDDDSTLAKKLLCIVDDGVVRQHPELLADIHSYCQRYRSSLHLICPPLVIPGGEQAKNDSEYVLTIQEAIHQHGICRQSFVVVIGGGAVIDMVGYAAATAHRGVRLIRIPTTVLAQNDSGIGVKNSVNAFGKKNFLGTFAPPVAVLNDADFLTTLSKRDWRSGLSEAVKVALLKDSAFFTLMEQQAGQLAERNMEAMQQVIYRCACLHLDHIATNGDPFEFGSSRPLDFGHWAAHKLEQLSNYMLRHGEAVAIGIALDATYSYVMGLLSHSDWQRILTLFSTLGLACYAKELNAHMQQPNDPRCILTGLHEFREHLGGELTIMLLKGIGNGIEVHSIDEEMMKRSIRLLEHYQSHHKMEEQDEHAGTGLSSHAAAAT